MKIKRSEDGCYLCSLCGCRTLTEIDHRWHLKAHQIYGSSLPSLSGSKTTVESQVKKYRSYINDIGRDEEKKVLLTIKKFGFYSAPYDYNDPEYVKLRDKKLKDVNYRCEICFNKDGVQCHHIIPAATAPHLFYDPSNLVVLCQKHHAEVHRRYNDVRSNYEHVEWDEGAYSDYEHWRTCEECGKQFFSKYRVCYDCAFGEHLF